MEKKKPSQILTLIAIGSLLISFVAIAFFIVPKISSLKQLASDNSAKKQELEVGKQKVTTIKEGIQVIAKAKKDIETLEIAIPSQPKAEEALVQVSAAAAQAGLEIKAVNIGVAQQSAVLISVSTAGGYDKTISFMDTLQKSLRPAKFSDYTMVGKDNGQNVETTFSILFPYLEEQTQGTTGQEGTQGTGQEEQSLQGAQK